MSLSGPYGNIHGDIYQIHLCGSAGVVGSESYVIPPYFPQDHEVNVTDYIGIEEIATCAPAGLCSLSHNTCETGVTD